MNTQLAWKLCTAGTMLERASGADRFLAPLRNMYPPLVLLLGHSISRLQFLSKQDTKMWLLIERVSVES